MGSVPGIRTQPRHLMLATIGAAIVSNSRTFGETVLQKALAFVEDQAPGRVAAVQIGSEHYG